jgi:hypothetical protein
VGSKSVDWRWEMLCCMGSVLCLCDRKDLCTFVTWQMGIKWIIAILYWVSSCADFFCGWAYLLVWILCVWTLSVYIKSFNSLSMREYFFDFCVLMCHFVLKKCPCISPSISAEFVTEGATSGICGSGGIIYPDQCLFSIFLDVAQVMIITQEI